MSIESQSDEGLKEQVRSFWNAMPCGTQFTKLEWGTPEFYADVEKTRYDTHPFMREVAEFDHFRGQKLLEIGSGLGTDLISFARGGAKVSCVDLTPNGIDLIKKRFAAEGREVDARVGDAEHLPFGDEEFDVVYSFGVLHHTPDIKAAADEVYRVLKPGGRIIIMLYHMNSMRVWLGTPMHIVKQAMRGNLLWGKKALEDWNRIYDGLDNPLGRAYTKDDVEQIFHRFHDRHYTVCHPMRMSLPPTLNMLGQRYLAPWCGFFLVLKASK